MIFLDPFEAETRNQIESLYTQRHAPMVYGMLRWIRPAHVIEIGAFKGFMSAWILKALQHNGGGRLTIIDNFSDYRSSPDTIENNLAAFGFELGRDFDIFVGTSAEWQRAAPKQRVDVAIIDGDHTLAGCWQDLTIAKQSGAIAIGFHDVGSWEGVGLCVDMLHEDQRWNVIELPFDAGYAFAIKKFARDYVFPREQAHAY